jgi:hypothetical protein
MIEDLRAKSEVLSVVKLVELRAMKVMKEGNENVKIQNRKENSSSMFQGLKVWLNRISNNMVLLLLNK